MNKNPEESNVINNPIETKLSTLHEISSEDFNDFLMSLLTADVRIEYLETYLNSETQSFAKTYDFALKQLPVYFNILKNNMSEDTQLLAKGMIWLGVIGYAAVQAGGGEEDNHLLDAINKYSNITEEDIENLDISQINSIMLGICYQKVKPLIDTFQQKMIDET